MRTFDWRIWLVVFLVGSSFVNAQPMPLDWKEISSLPDPLGVAGPFVGVHNETLIVAGGANFPQPIWESNKVWHDRIYAIAKDDAGYSSQETAMRLPNPIGYGAAVSTAKGIVCIGGNHGEKFYDNVFRMEWDATESQLRFVDLPPLPKPCAYGQAALIGSTIYLAGGQSDSSLDSAMKNLWSLDLSLENDETKDDFRWVQHTPWPSVPRAFNLTVAQHNGFDNCVYVMSGRRQNGEQVDFLKDVWEYTPRTGVWRARAELPNCMMAGTATPFGQSHIFVMGGADGSLFGKANELKDEHPGFPRSAFAYHTITNTWCDAEPPEQNHVTTVPVVWNDRMIVASGEVRPRVRSPKIWSVAPPIKHRSFGMLNYLVLLGYLLLTLGLGVYFSRRNANTEDYFRGGKSIPWWAAGCSIFATMLSSLTYTGLPSKSFAQDWVYIAGSIMIPVVAIFAVFVALPFYRRIDATSAYEYFELRFGRSVRLFASSSFTLFHVFRMAVVMSLTGLALAVATPLTATQSVLLMGALSIFYCTLGGIEAVIWTDTLQTIVLLGGALFALAALLNQSDVGISGAIEIAGDADKLRMANFTWSPTDAQLAFWVLIVGGLGQSLSSYTADQAVVQRYMTTPDEKLAARSIWTNAVMAVPASMLFMAIGTGLYVFYHNHPEKLDATTTTDQIFPLFIANEMPIGIAGLIVAGIFSAAQSTVSTSMNSTATTVVTDFMRPYRLAKTESGYLNAARIVTVLMGILGTLLGLFFINPEIRSLFDAFLKVIGIFMGVLGGLFVLGVLTRRANTVGAIAGAVVGATTMICLWKFTSIQAYLYAACGVASCVFAGYVVSLLTGASTKDLTGLTIHTPSSSN